MQGFPLVLAAGLLFAGAMALPTAAAAGWEEEFREWRDCVIDEVMPLPPHRICFQEFQEFADAFRKDFFPWCVKPQPDQLPDNPVDAVHIGPCD